MARAIAEAFLDFRHALRLLRKAPVFAGVATLSLGLGMGANVAIFSLANAVVLKPLPVDEPDRLVRIQPGDRRRAGFFTNPIWEEIRDREELFESSFAWSARRVDVSSQGEPTWAPGLLASGGFFEVLGVRPIVGRTFTRADDRRGGGSEGPVAVISHSYWQRRYAGAPDVVGGRITLDGHDFTIIGVTPPGFFGVEVGRAFSVAVPLSAYTLLSGEADGLDRRDVWWLRIMGRLKRGQELSQALAALRTSQPAIRAATLPPERRPGDQASHLSQPIELTESSTGTSFLRVRYRTTLFLLMGIVGLILLLACANLANLLLARASARRREMAVRMALGASRLRLVRQLLAESLVLSLLGAGAGLVFAHWATRLLVRQLSSRLGEVSLGLALDWRVLAFTAATALSTALVFGVVPALRSTSRQASSTLQGGARDVPGLRRFSVENVFASLQMALSLVLVFGAMLFVRSFTALSTAETGFDRENVMVVSLDAQRAKLPSGERGRVFDEALDAVRRVRGVDSAGAALFAPLSGAWSEGPVDVAGFESLPPDDRRVYFNAITEDYFRSLGAPLLAGRDFRHTDGAGATRVAIVNESFARRFFRGSNPVGQVFAHGETGPVSIVGLVADTKYRNLREPPPPPAFLPVRQQAAVEPWLHLVVRGGGDRTPLTRDIVAAVARVSEHVVLDPRALERDVADSVVQERLVATLSAFFGVLALVVGGTGLFGLVSLAVGRREREIGVRLALGAAPRAVFWMVLGDALMVTAVGSAIGSLGALMSARVTSALVFGVASTDPATLASALVTLGVAAAAAGFFPARRASRMSPASLLRQER